MSRPSWFAIVALIGASAFGTGVAAHVAKPVTDGAVGAPPRPRWEGRRVPIESSLEVAPLAEPTPSIREQPALRPRSSPPTVESAYESCRRGFYERGVPYDFDACEPLR